VCGDRWRAHPLWRDLVEDFHRTLLAPVAIDRNRPHRERRRDGTPQQTIKGDGFVGDRNSVYLHRAGLLNHTVDRNTAPVMMLGRPNKGWRRDLSKFRDSMRMVW